MEKSRTIIPTVINGHQGRSIPDAFSQVIVQMVGSQVSLCRRAVLISVTCFLLAVKDMSRNDGSGP